MWASAPTNIHEKSTDLEGGQSRPPLQRSMKNHAGQAKNHRVSHFMPGRADVGIGPYNRPHKAPDLEGGQSRPPLQRGLKTRRVRRKLLRLPFCVVGVDAHIDPFRRQNGNTPAGAEGRCCTGFRFRTVGADDPVRPPELSGFMEIRCEIATFWRADVGIGPYMRWYFRFHIVGVDAHIDPQEMAGLWRPSGESVSVFRFSP